MPQWRSYPNGAFVISALRRVLAILLLGLLTVSFARAEGADFSHSAFDDLLIEQGAEQRTDAHSAGSNCAVPCSASACITSLPEALHFQVATALPCSSLAPAVARHLRAPDTAPPRVSFD